MRIDVLTLWPGFIHQCTALGVVGRARQRGLLCVESWDLRHYASNAYRNVDGRPFGGGPGMVMLIDPVRAALKAMRKAAPEPAHVIYLSPQGARLTQGKVRALADRPRIALLCGRYEGVDERLLMHEVDEELSIGDYVLSGGELAAAVVIDAMGRLQEGVLNNPGSAGQDSFANGLLDYPHYSKPVHDALGDVPHVLLEGNHAAIRRWRIKQALGRTWLRRPDLLAQTTLDTESRGLLNEFCRDYALKAIAGLEA